MISGGARWTFQSVQKRIDRVIDLKALRETAARERAHLGALRGRRGLPALEEAAGASEIIVLRVAATIGHDLAPDVHLVRDEDGDSAGERFHDCDAEILLVGRQDESFRRAEGTPFWFPSQHPGEGHRRGIHGGEEFAR